MLRLIRLKPPLIPPTARLPPPRSAFRLLPCAAAMLKPIDIDCKLWLARLNFSTIAFLVRRRGLGGNPWKFFAPSYAAVRSLKRPTDKLPMPCTFSFAGGFLGRVFLADSSAKVTRFYKIVSLASSLDYLLWALDARIVFPCDIIDFFVCWTGMAGALRELRRLGGLAFS